MRHGVLSDIHANLPALERALRILRAERVDAYLCAGDVVGYGPHPNECVERLAELGAVTVAGNHDRMAIGRMALAGTTPLVAETIAWTRAALGDAARSYLEELPHTAEVPNGAVVSHGGLDDARAYVREEREMAAELERLEERFPAARVLVLGHAHDQIAYRQGRGPFRGERVPLGAEGRWLLNPGAVGQARERRPYVRFMVLDLDGWRVRFFAERYDDRSVRQALRERGLPQEAHHPGRPRARRRAPGALSRLRRALG